MTLAQKILLYCVNITLRIELHTSRKERKKEGESEATTIYTQHYAIENRIVFSFRQQFAKLDFTIFYKPRWKRKVRSKAKKREKSGEWGRDGECDIYCAPEHNKILGFIHRGEISLIGLVGWEGGGKELLCLSCGSAAGCAGCDTYVGYSAFKWMPQIYIKSINHGICRAHCQRHFACFGWNYCEISLISTLVVAYSPLQISISSLIRPVAGTDCESGADPRGKRPPWQHMSLHNKRDRGQDSKGVMMNDASQARPGQ